MPPLSNQRHERFCQLLAQGKTATDAYEEAGYKANRHNAAALAKTEEIAARVTQISTGVADKVANKLVITAQTLIAEVDEIMGLAKEAGQHAVALNCIKEKGILSGKRIERTESGEPGEFAAVEDHAMMDELRREASQLGIDLPDFDLDDGATAH